MNFSELKELSAYINTLADASKKITSKGFGCNFFSETKKDGSPVTKFDINAEKIICDQILKKFPNHNIVAEENGSVTNESDYTWIIDPIDGTRSYIIGRPLWGTLIGFAFKGQPLIGLADFPTLNERWLGMGNNCFLNDLDYHFKANEIKNLSEATIASTSPNLFSVEGSTKYKKLLDKAKYHTWSGDCHNYCLVLKGGLDLVVEEGLSSYDILPLVPILKSQNIQITDWEGKELKLENDTFYKYKTIVASSSEVYDQAISLLK